MSSQSNSERKEKDGGGFLIGLDSHEEFEKHQDKGAERPRGEEPSAPPPEDAPAPPGKEETSKNG